MRYSTSGRGRDKKHRPYPPERSPVTVCVAASFAWNYAHKDKPTDFGPAAIIASDRMLTAGDVQYEPNKRKFAEINKSTFIWVSGDYAFHSKAVKDTFKLTNATSTVENVATIYGQALQAIKRKEAEDLYLAPLGLNTDTFIAQQKDMSDTFVATLREQLQNHRSEETEAIVVGPQIVRDQSQMRIFTVDTHGIVSCHDDLAFATIGSGAWHARSRLTQWGYTNTVTFGPAMAAVYAAKKAAEVAPGVGKATDMVVIFRDHAEFLREDFAAGLSDIYKRYEEHHLALVRTSLEEISELLAKDGRVGEGKGSPTAGAQAGRGPPSAAAEATRSDENGAQETDEN